jgi:hypothetical protein
LEPNTSQWVFIPNAGQVHFVSVFADVIDVICHLFFRTGAYDVYRILIPILGSRETLIQLKFGSGAGF